MVHVLVIQVLLVLLVLLALVLRLRNHGLLGEGHLQPRAVS